MKKVISAVALLGLVGCSGSIVVYKDADSACKDGACNGVLFYQLVPTPDSYYLDRILDKDANLTHFSGWADSRKCEPLLVTEIKMLPSSKPSLITYDAMLFETSKFSVDLAPNGALVKAGSEATPGAKMAVDTVATIATSVKTLRDTGVMSAEERKADIEQKLNSHVPLCSAGRVPVKTPPEAPACGVSGKPPCAKG